MDVYDTNVWIFGLHDPDSRAGHLVQQAIHGDRKVAVDAYIYKEVIRNIGQGLSSENATEVTNAFATFVEKSDTIQGPTQERVGKINIDDIRADCRVRLVGDAIGCQAKDAPVVELAYALAVDRDGRPTIFTNDGKGDSNRGLVDVDFGEYEEVVRQRGELPNRANPLGLIDTEYVPEPTSIS